MKGICFSLVFGLLFMFSGCKDKESSFIPFEEQLRIDLEVIDAFLDASDIETEIHESGIRYTVDRVGDGISPTREDAVIVKYRGTFLNGEEFDGNDIGVPFDLGGLITALQVMIPEMMEGGKITIYAPSIYCLVPEEMAPSHQMRI